LLIYKSPDLNPLDYHVRCNTGTLYTLKPTNIAELKTALLQYGMICHSSSLIRQPCDFERDFDFELLQLADTLNTHLTTERTADIHYWSVWSVDEKFVQCLICY